MTTTLQTCQAFIAQALRQPHVQMGLRAVVTLLLLTWLWFHVDIASVVALLANAHVEWLLLALAIYVLGMGAAVWRWQLLLRGLGAVYAYVLLARIFLISCFFSMFLPSSIGGDVARMVMLRSDTARREDIVSSVFVDRLVGLGVILVGGFLAGLALPVVRETPAVMLTLILFCMIFGVGVLLLMSRSIMSWMVSMVPVTLRERLRPLASRIYHSILSFRHSPDALAGAVLTSLLLQIATCLSVYCAGQAFGISASMLIYFAIVPIGLAITTLPLSINGLGVQDHVLLLLFASMGIPAAPALALSLALHLFRNIVGVVGGICFAFSKDKIRSESLAE